MIKNGVKSANQIQFQNMEGDPVVPVLGDKGGLIVELADDDTVRGMNRVLYCDVIAGLAPTQNKSIVVSGKVSTIDVANLSKTTSLKVQINTGAEFLPSITDYFIIAPQVAVELPINTTISAIYLDITETDETAQAQVVVKGVPAE